MFTRPGQASPRPAVPNKTRIDKTQVRGVPMRRSSPVAQLLGRAALGALLCVAFVGSCVFATNASQMSLPGFGQLAADAPRADSPSGPEGDWRLVLVNDEHPMEPYQPELTQLRDGQAVDSRCYPDLQRMFDAARADGLEPKVNSSYRSREDQQRVLDEAISRGESEGLSAEEARSRALCTVAEPGTSEHETGLAIDVTSERQTREENEAVWGWMAAHGWEYGWILRYPAGKEGLTGISHEPWHFRYVGGEAAREMHDADLCLEEYV